MPGLWAAAGCWADTGLVFVTSDIPEVWPPPSAAEGAAGSFLALDSSLWDGLPAGLVATQGTCEVLLFWAQGKALLKRLGQQPTGAPKRNAEPGFRQELPDTRCTGPEGDSAIHLMLSLFEGAG